MSTLIRHYLGIDLGTTNSCIAWGQFDSFSQRIKPELIPVRMTGAIAQELMPSVIMYKEGQQYPIAVGASAKQQLLYDTFDPETVIIRSVKLQMGKPSVSEAPWLTPEQVSSDILRALKYSAEQKFGGDSQTDVVIGVPACFDIDKWQATKRAAQLAGFTNIRLIDEPKAALLDFINEQDQMSPENRILDFNRPKIVCIFDPGGGTLDVSIVRVQQSLISRGSRSLNEIQYEDLGLTRQPFLGGDDFDILLANFLKEKFALDTGINLDEIPEKKRIRVYNRLVEYAEDAKKYLSDQILNGVVFQNKSEEEATSSAFTNVVISHLYQAYTLTYNLRYREFVNVVSSLLGWGLTPGDIEKTEIQSKLAYQEHIQKCENIIYPIYDALIKAKARTGSIPKVDVVLINGGLSKLPIIRSRLREFFGRQVPIIEVPSPDLSVARGASLYHYNFVNGLDRSSNLLPEGISLEVSQGEFVLLIPANTQYPTTKPIIPQGFQLIIPEAGIPFINIPLWRGEPPHPSAKLIDRKIDLQDQAAYLQKGDIVDIHLTIDTNRQLRLDAWLHRNPNVRFSVTTQYR